MSLTHLPPEKVGIMKLSTELRNIIWTEALSIKQSRYIQSSKKSILQSLRLTCRTIYNDLESEFPKEYLQNQTFTFQTLESFLKCAPLYTRAEQVLLRSVHIQFYETPDSHRYKDSPQVLYTRQNFLLDEILLPKYHGINEWIFDVSNLFNSHQSFSYRHITYFLRYCPAENLTLIFNTCDGSFMNCAQPRKGFRHVITDERTLSEFETDAENLAQRAQRWNGDGETSEKTSRDSTVLIMQRPTQLPRDPNPDIPYWKYNKLDDPRDPWLDIKKHARNSISHGTKWKMETWKRGRERRADAKDKRSAGLVRVVREKKEVVILKLFEESGLDRVWV
ncbi:uncharacterized protein Bfra_010526 [Botrytis fragariae]|uniref:F-box domain-containing protein n=1 Tax=Botrytis fragariae TaxID=1964551 RepID=A0A8H6AG14_9HELO|nr:uncharacterized protein Bfra_010526 [Botrytis fragariae]KAF5867551.1 hypothetical protein Bfra_010526 [Botrytis fragariae]